MSIQPERCQLIVFPLVNRVGKVRDVAFKMLDKATDRHADFYRHQVTEALLRHLDRMGIGKVEQDEQIGAFWAKVQDEMNRLSYHFNRPGGAA
ncbi:DUF6074 family protein [Phyllobacterium calauticae]|jgi:Family of unknown function (DUF6074)|uniref:DUF6074 family protein n=1 Tax=Phyllobacterium calauticae TaxID=2817027 RepID=UPI001CC0FE2A|nr:DUF6074 family protein [Phyllobacterium calauticae]MBZ3693228.1 hypothetical protein [Phyllobacterium calauticae]